MKAGRSVPRGAGAIELGIRRCVWARVSVLFWSILAMLPVAAVLLRNRFLSNLFELGSGQGVGLAALIGILTAWVCSLTAVLAWSYAPRRIPMRFEPLPLIRGLTVLRWMGLGSLGAAPLLVVLILRAERRLEAVLGVLGAVAVAALVFKALWFVVWFTTVRRPPRRDGRLAEWVRRVLGPVWTDGYVVREDGRTRFLVGHFIALLLLVLAGAGLVAGYWLWRPGAERLPQPPAVVYLLWLILVLDVLLAGVAFFFDRLRVPTLLLVLSWSFIMLEVNGPHTFDLHAAESSVQLPAVDAPVDPWLADRAGSMRGSQAGASRSPGRGKPLMVVVCASGGGIHAAAWTASVLTWLHEDEALGPAFTESIRFMSGVSGGSVGLMYFMEGLDRFPARSDKPMTSAVRAASRRSSLAETAWGMLYLDVRRGVFPVEPVARIDRGRGWALEQAWRRLPEGFGPERLDARWSDWIQRTAAGGPGIVFNAFDVDSGDRVLFSTVEIPTPDEAGDLPKTRTLTDLAETEGRGPSPDVDVVTAARLSATFPYVAPIARPKPVEGASGLAAKPMYLADGGYFDSSGLMTAVDWIRALLRHDGGVYRERLGGIVLLEIRAFGNAESVEQREGRHGDFGEAWIKAFSGPIEGMLSVRTAAQVARNRTAVSMLRSAHGRDFIHHLAFAPSGSGWPVSWHLSMSDLRRLQAEKGSEAFQSTKDRLIRLWSGRKDNP